MKSKKHFSFLLLLGLGYFLVSFFLSVQSLPAEEKEEEKLLQSMHSISSHQLFDYVKELASDKYGGRLTGTEEYNASAEWVVSHFKKWGIAPALSQNSYFQAFPIPYTLVFKGCEVYLHLPSKGSVIRKYYQYESEFIPGSTSGSGEVTAEVIYVGYGATAPELGYDDYKGVDVKGKIILMEREVPVSPDKDPELFKKWRPYSFHQYKLENAVAHGAKGMLYNYGPISNPNNSYDKGFIYSHVGSAVVSDVFSGTGRKHKDVVDKIKKTLKPQSFATGKTFTIKNITEHYPDGVGYNVIGILEGSDPDLKDEVIILGGHLDHLGRCYEIMPGANDNASAVAVIMGIAEAMSKCPIKPRRSVIFLCFGAEEQGVVGSEYYLEHPVFPLEKTVGLINMDGVGCGDKLRALAAKNYPKFWKFIDKANQKYVHRVVSPRYFANIARPRLDAARFMWKDVPTISFGARGSRSYYHITKDDIDTITPEILEDLAQLLFIATLDMANQNLLDFRK
ncbi:MAG: M28 family peptidase [Candidatus Aminicenantes bacterium]|nr:M28 family peptidase [Candidatus Aminicenantes bacterium]